MCLKPTGRNGRCVAGSVKLEISGPIGALDPLDVADLCSGHRGNPDAIGILLGTQMMIRRSVTA